MEFLYGFGRERLWNISYLVWHKYKIQCFLWDPESWKFKLSCEHTQLKYTPSKFKIHMGYKRISFITGYNGESKPTTSNYNTGQNLLTNFIHTLGTRKCWNIKPERREVSEIWTTISLDKCLQTILSHAAGKNEWTGPEELAEWRIQRSKFKEAESYRSVRRTLKKNNAKKKPLEIYIRIFLRNC